MPFQTSYGRLKMNSLHKCKLKRQQPKKIYLKTSVHPCALILWLTSSSTYLPLWNINLKYLVMGISFPDIFTMPISLLLTLLSLHSIFSSYSDLI